MSALFVKITSLSRCLAALATSFILGEEREPPSVGERLLESRLGAGLDAGPELEPRREAIPTAGQGLMQLRRTPLTPAFWMR